MRNPGLTIWLVWMLLIGISCSSSKKTQSEVREPIEPELQTVVPDTFVLPHVPKTLTSSEDRAAYLVMHFWDRFDFTDRELIDRPEITEQAFVDYINILDYVPGKTADASFLNTLDKAEADTAVFVHFATLFEKYFYDPNSPFRNEEYYLPVLQELVQSSLLPQTNLERYEFQLEMAMKNRIGQKATDITYTLASGQSFALHDLKSEFTLLMFSDPGCPTCEAVMEQLSQSKELNEALSLNSPTRTMLTILTFYLYNDLDEWNRHLQGMPVKWVHGYDKEMKVLNHRLYDIKAIPTLYLLDKEKKVILKDTSIEAIEAFFSVNH